MGGMLSIKYSNNHTYKYGIKSRDYFYEEILPKIPKEGLKLLDDEHKIQQDVHDLEQDTQFDDKQLIHDDEAIRKTKAVTRANDEQSQQETEDSLSNDKSMSKRTETNHSTPADAHIHCESVILSKQQTFQVFNTFVKMDKTLDGVINSSKVSVRSMQSDHLDSQDYLSQLLITIICVA